MQDSIPARKVDAETYLAEVKKIIEAGREVSLIITGGSMLPFLANERDRILVSRIEEPLKKGDMAFFRRDNGKYVMHRIRRIKPDKGKGGEQYFFIGDAQRITEGPVRRDQIFGVITAVCRKGKWLRPGDFRWEFFRVIWLRIIPFRHVLMRIYGMLVRMKRK